MEFCGNRLFGARRERFGIVPGGGGGGASHSGRRGPKDQRRFYPGNSRWELELWDWCLFLWEGWEMRGVWPRKLGFWLQELGFWGLKIGIFPLKIGFFALKIGVVGLKMGVFFPQNCEGLS